MKKIYIFWMIVGALAFGIAILLFVKGQTVMRFFSSGNDDIDYVKG